jgi:hypothetical protein
MGRLAQIYEGSQRRSYRPFDWTRWSLWTRETPAVIIMRIHGGRFIRGFVMLDINYNALHSFPRLRVCVYCSFGLPGRDRHCEQSADIGVSGVFICSLILLALVSAALAPIGWFVILLLDKPLVGDICMVRRNLQPYYTL